MKTQRFVAVTMGIMVLSAGLLFTAGCGSDDQSAVPQQGVSTPIGVLAVSAGLNHSLAVKKSNGTVWAWGGNGSGKLGNLAAQIKQPTPVEVGESPPGVTSFLGMVAVSAGHTHSLALKGDGTVWAWGSDAAGQLGNDVPLVNQPTPVQVKGAGGSGFLTDMAAVSAGGSHSLALKGDGTVWAWGSDFAGQVGNDDAVGGTEPTPVPVDRTNLGP